MSNRHFLTRNYIAEIDFLIADYDGQNVLNRRDYFLFHRCRVARGHAAYNETAFLALQAQMAGNRTNKFIFGFQTFDGKLNYFNFLKFHILQQH